MWSFSEYVHSGLATVQSLQAVLHFGHEGPRSSLSIPVSVSMELHPGESSYGLWSGLQPVILKSKCNENSQFIKLRFTSIFYLSSSLSNFS